VHTHSACPLGRGAWSQHRMAGTFLLRQTPPLWPFTSMEGQSALGSGFDFGAYWAHGL